MLIGLDGKTISVGSTYNEETIRRVNAELQQLSELLHIRWMPFAAGGREGRYAFCSYWADVDKRRQWVRDGTYSPDDAFDIIGWSCEDIFKADSQPVSPDDCVHRVVEMLRHCDNERFPWRLRMAEVVEHNLRQREKARKAVVDELHDIFVDHYYHSNRATRIFPGGKEAKHVEVRFDD